MRRVKILVPISGGKDSQACLKMAMSEYPPERVQGLFCDTQWEHPATYAHVEKLRTLYGQLDVVTITGGSVLEKSLKYGRFPGGGARHCTDELKIRETRIYCKQLAERQGAFEVWYGMRTGESSERGKRYADHSDWNLYQPHEVLPNKYPQYLGSMGVRFRLPIVDWTTTEVMAYLEGQHNPLYNQGFDRVGCFPCLASGDAWKEKAFAHDAFGADQKAKVMIVSEQIGKSIWTSKGGKSRNEVCSICEI